MEPVLKLQIEPDWSAVDRVRGQSVTFLREHGLAVEVIDALSMVVCELTENAVKYGRFEGDARGISVSVAMRAREVIVEVTSPVAHADDEAVAKLDYMIQWIRGHQDPFEAYLERLKEVSAQHLASPESGLGLVRIAYEGHSILDFYVNDQSILAVSAVFPLDAVAMGTAPPNPEPGAPS
jgi:hypothetical protein